MPRINRSDTFYVSLPGSWATKTLPDAKLQISLNVTYPKGLERATEKTIIRVMEEADNIFRKSFRKEMKKIDEKWERYFEKDD